ncbi:MAG TPA: hypothetical protein VKR06_46520 [Ktedonosporobacter sp.]|nr:hypothetical protein [Ktedonosporobacter sp.]
MNDDIKRYQYLRPSLVLSPSGKAITRLVGDKVCVVRLLETPAWTRYYYAVIDLMTGEAAEGHEYNLAVLQRAFENSGLAITPYQRIWSALEWW